MAALNLVNINKSFGRVEVIRDVSLSVLDGEFVVFVGPSGCGKSTLLRLVAGLEQATSGNVQIGEKDVTEADPADRGVAMVFQSYALYPHMTVAENMGFGLKMNGMPSDELKLRVESAAKTLHLSELLQRKPKQLSGGQRQRVAIGRAIVRQPEIFLFDEPLSNLDAELRVQMRLELAKLHQELDATMIYVTHDQVEAMTLADKIVVLKDGRIEQIGSPLELYENPVNTFVAGFIGSPRINFIHAIVDQQTESQTTLRLPDYDNTSIPLTLLDARPSPGSQMLLGIRPEQFNLDRQIQSGTDASIDQHGAQPQWATINTRVDVVENLGGTAYVYTRNEDNSPMLTIEIGNTHRVNENENLAVSFNANNTLLFDQQSQQRIL